MIRVDLVDPPAYSPPYDDALASALARAGADVRLVTSRFAFAEPLPSAGYQTEEFFYRHARGAPGSPLRTLIKTVEHLPDTLRYRASTTAEVVHFQWLTLPQIDLRLLPDRPTVLTIHDPMARGLVDRVAPQARLLRALPAVVVHTDAARRALTGQGLDSARVHVIRHGAFTHLVALAANAILPPELTADANPRERGPIALYFGLIRPYKGLETLLDAWRGIGNAQLWVVGRPMFDIASLRRAAPTNVRFVERFVSYPEAAALYENADVVVLPYARGARFGFSGVLASALGFGKPAVVSDVDGFAEVVKLGAARSVPAGDAPALHAALQQLLTDRDERQKVAAAARAAAAGPYSWDRIATATLELYDTIRTK